MALGEWTAPPVTSRSAAKRTELRAAYAETAATLIRTNDADMSKGVPGSEEEFTALVARMWELAEDWTLATLSERPAIPARELAAAIRTISPDPVPGEDRGRGALDAEAVQLANGESAAYAIALHFGKDDILLGTVLVVSRTPATGYRVSWRIRDVPIDERARKGELERWKFSGHGWHDGPLNGAILRLPDRTSGQARFVVRGVSRTDVGFNCPGQVSVWSWTGATAELDLVGMYDAPGFSAPFEFRGDSIRVRVATPSTCFVPCGSCPGPMSTWLIRVDGNGVKDAGRVPDDPELDALEALLTRVEAGKDASDLAAPEVVRYFSSEFAADHERYGKDDGCYVGMIQSWKVKRAGSTSLLDFWADRLYPLTIHLERRAAGFFVTQIDEHPEPQ